MLAKHSQVQDGRTVQNCLQTELLDVELKGHGALWNYSQDTMQVLYNVTGGPTPEMVNDPGKDCEGEPIGKCFARCVIWEGKIFGKYFEGSL